MYILYYVYKLYILNHLHRYYLNDQKCCTSSGFEEPCRQVVFPTRCQEQRDDALPGFYCLVSSHEVRATCRGCSTSYLPIVCSTVYMEVSWHGGTPKSSVLRGFSLINHPFWGTLIYGTPSNWQNYRKTKVLGSGHGMFSFVRKHSQPIGDHPLTDTLVLHKAGKYKPSQPIGDHPTSALFIVGSK